jgi:glycosyltransferase involved in cell wall biosynthesis
VVLHAAVNKINYLTKRLGKYLAVTVNSFIEPLTSMQTRSNALYFDEAAREQPHAGDASGAGVSYLEESASERGLSIVVPIYNEEESIPHLYGELKEVLLGMNEPHQIILVDDGSRDASLKVIAETVAGDDSVEVLEFRRNFGQTAAMAAGFAQARYPIVIALDADLQNDPSEIPRMVELLRSGGYDLVAGWRKERQDRWFSRRLPSMLANRLISLCTNVRLHDYGCTLKVMTREVAQGIRLYGEMHRFIPALADEFGAKIVEIPVRHRERQFGKSKYGISRTIRVVLDLLTVKFLLGYSKRPIHFFGVIGFVTSGLGAFLLAMITFQRTFMGIPMGSRPVLPLSVMLIIIGVQFVVFGLLAEVLARTYYESQSKTIFEVRRVHRYGCDRKAPEKIAV